ncbi:hypothetical protein SDRG_02372 [Saprolegnia diclina VS20]|uniref:Bax inhibitor 1 n=1 Tax=Saprolegnia diclina (strain VS20) TaxID=1156394 RepID=T0R2H2_SAPDV|nr:hypothetical protein SDRG_02372 [Saprolegnia diclina VS20]EQC40480.1 hypothetical protein SDRG_02372 [Saprolegnia diclina VS20]|eukprot:XP_008606179.1 hypothetical protein SDRG_02372 [Saprolegnia diclina VS20]
MQTISPVTETTHLTAPKLLDDNAAVAMVAERPELTWEIVWAKTDVSAHVRRHLLRVYMTLGCMLLFAALGVVLDLIWPVHPAITGLAIAMPLMLLIAYTSPELVVLRVSGAMLLATALGASIGGTVQHALSVDSSLVGVAFGCTMLIFVVMSLCAYCATRRSALFLYGFLVSALLVLLAVGIANIFIQSKLLVWLGLYVGLVLFSIFVIVDTQLIIERIMFGEDDFVEHALDLFTDIVGIFVRLLTLLSSDDDDDDDDDE